MKNRFMKNKFRKNRFLQILTGAVLVCTLLGSTAVWAADDTVSMVPADSAETETVESYLTGEQVAASVGRRRPVAVMLGNSVDGAPQSGISNAGVVYEAPVEGGITRLMAIIEDYDNLEKIGSVRSCRDYFLYYANEFNAIYTHYGQAAYALPYLNQHVIDNMNGLTMGSTAFYRTSDRSAPHNAYTSASLIQNGISAMGYSQDYSSEYTGHYLFTDEGTETTLEDQASAISASVVRLGNFTDNNPYYEYDASTKEYKRYQFGAAHADEVTGEQLTCANILLQYSSYSYYDSNGYLNVDTISGGSGKYITRGKAIDITWQKDAVWGVTHYFDQNGQELKLNRGVTWVEIVQNDKIDAITYE